MIVLKARWPVASRVVAPGLLTLLATLLMVAGMLVVGASPAEAVTTFTVNKTGDRGDRNIDGVCDSKRDNGQQCPLRAAIEEANATQGADIIDFDISGPKQVIKPDSELPTITDTVTIDGYTQQGASPNTLAEGNDAVLKVKLNGSNAGADARGLRIDASDSTIKGLVINGFDGEGVRIAGVDATGNKVEGNFIGTNEDGTTDKGNGGDGVFVFDDSNTIGGDQPEMRNVISGNDRSGVIIFSSASDNRVEGNFIGTTADGSGDLGNTTDGVMVHSSSDNTVGGTAAGARNVISGNGANGVFMFGSLSDGNRVEGNFIGTTADGSGDLGNTREGVSVQGNDNAVGGTASGAGNRIAHNGGDGVSVSGSDAAGNNFLSNAVFSNGGLGIDLGSDGVTDNDADDTDTGANNLQNFPVITSVIEVPVAGDTLIAGTLDSAPSLDYAVQCFLTDGASASDHGEGSLLLDTKVVTTDANGDGGFVCVSSNPILGQVPGQTVSATATNILTTGDTSEFSENEPVPGPGP